MQKLAIALIMVILSVAVMANLSYAHYTGGVTCIFVKMITMLIMIFYSFGMFALYDLYKKAPLWGLNLQESLNYFLADDFSGSSAYPFSTICFSISFDRDWETCQKSKRSLST